MQRIILGTAQFGLNYGINNKGGKIPEAEIFRILEFAENHGIQELDTAESYGDAEEIIGRYHETRQHEFKIITKISAVPGKNIEERILS